MDNNMSENNTDKLIEQCRDILIGIKVGKDPQIVLYYLDTAKQWGAFAMENNDSLKKDELCYEGNFVCGYGETINQALLNFKKELVRIFNEIYN
jgi:hypothetical protein